MKANKITEFTRATCGQLGTAVEVALKPVAEKYGVTFVRHGGSFSLTSYNLKIEAAVASKDGTVMTRTAQDFISLCEAYDLKPEDLGKTFRDDSGTAWKITGLAARSDKYPILATRVDNGKTYKLGAKMVQRGLGRTRTSVDDMGLADNAEQKGKVA